MTSKGRHVSLLAILSMRRLDYIELLFANRSSETSYNRKAWSNGCGLLVCCKTVKFYSVSAPTVECGKTLEWGVATEMYWLATKLPTNNDILPTSDDRLPTNDDRLPTNDDRLPTSGDR